MTAPAKPATPAAPAAAPAATSASNATSAKNATSASTSAAAKPAAAAAAPGAKAGDAAAPTNAAAEQPKLVKLGDPVDAAAEEPKPEPKLGDPVDEPEAPAEGEADAATEADEADADEQQPIEYSFEPAEGAPAYSQPVIDAYKEVLQKHRVDPAIAKDVLDTMLPVIQQDLETQAKQHYEATATEWKAELQRRHGEKSAEVMRQANKALDVARKQGAAKDELINFLSGSVLAVNPDFVDMLAFFGQRLSNDRGVPRGGDPERKPLSPKEEAAAEYERNAAKRGT